jgi:hypothetical protein
VHDGSRTQETEEAGGLMVESWCYFAMLFNICLRAKVRVMENLPCICVYVCVCVCVSAQVR